MPSLRSFKRMLASSDDYYHSGMRANFTAYSSTGAKNTAWGGDFKTTFVNQLRSAKSVNPSAYGSYTGFKVLSQSAVRTRLGYQVIFDPAVASGTDYYTFAPTANTFVVDPGAPWDAYQGHAGGQSTASGTVPPTSYSPRNAMGVWAYDGTNFAYWFYDQWITAGSPEVARDIFYMNPRGNFLSMESWYNNNRHSPGVSALYGDLPWTLDNLVPVSKR